MRLMEAQSVVVFDNEAALLSERTLDAPPPLEAPPVERSDSLPPLETVDEAAQQNSSDGVAHNEATSRTAAPADASTANTATAATPTPTPAIDLRALINKLAPIPITSSAAAATATAATPAASQPAFMTLDDWRKMSQSRPELSMRVLGEPSERKKKERGLTGLGGGWKATEGWKCESLNCIQYENRKYDTVCARCGAVRRFQRA